MSFGFESEVLDILSNFKLELPQTYDDVKQITFERLKVRFTILEQFVVSFEVFELFLKLLEVYSTVILMLLHLAVHSTTKDRLIETLFFEAE